MITLPKEIKTKTVITTAIKLEMKDINNDLTVQNSYKKKVISYLREYICSIDYQETDEVYDNIINISKLLKKCDNNIYSLEKLLSSLLDLKINVRENTINKSLTAIKNYNKDYTTSFDSINLNIEEIDNILNTAGNFVKETSKSKDYLENTLIISESDRKVILPYSLSKIYDILKDDSTYTSINDVIDKKYTIPIRYYQNAPISRFKEAYKLIKEREKGSTKAALDLAFELMLNNNLHPAIITACQTLDELDIYLSCLEYNEINDFHFFKILFKVPPQLSVKKTSSKNVKSETATD